MGRHLNLKVEYGSHLPVLLRALEMTQGDVLEMGAGYFSTPFLHWYCLTHRRNLVTIENNPAFYELMRQCEHPYHQVVLVENWDLAQIERPWDVALIDHAPPERRVVDVLRLATCCKYIVCHDTGWKQDRHYHYKEIYPRFKSIYHHVEFKPHCTSVLSNLVDLQDFAV